MSHPERKRRISTGVPTPVVSNAALKTPEKAHSQGDKKANPCPNPENAPYYTIRKKISSICNTTNEKINLTANLQSTSNITLLA
jgi:hypothetical protein